MNKNGRIYPYPIIDDITKCLKIHHSENYIYARYDEKYVKTIQNRGQARSIRKKTGIKDVITGDIFYTKLSWTKFSHNFELNNISSEKTGMAIIRNNEIIWYSMPGTPEGLAERKVLFEKINNYNEKRRITKIC